MSPRPGGESDKFGNRYEGAWTVRQLLRVLKGELDSVTVEEVDALGEGSEFTTRKGNDSAAYQIKRQQGNANSWTIASLNSKGVLASARRHVEAGRAFYFASTVPARPIQELTERAREPSDLQTFVNSYLTSALRPIFDGLSAVYGSAEVSWTVLRSLHVRWTDEAEMHQVNAALAGFLLKGAKPALAAVGLGDLAVHSLGQTLDVDTIERKLKVYGLSRASEGTDASGGRAVGDQTTAWMATVEHYVLRPEIARAETDQIRSFLEDGRRLVFAVGEGGSGKSVVLHDVVRALVERDWAVLAFRLDRLKPFSTTAGLGKQLGLAQSPAATLAKVAAGRYGVLVIDQLDAVSMASGRIPQTFDVIAKLVREASAFPNLRVLLACRKFDVDNDHQIRTLVDHRDTWRVDVNQLSDEQVASAVTAMGIDIATLTDRQRAIVRSPLHLVLLKSVAEQSPAPSFTTITGLFGEFWHRKYLECRVNRDHPPDFDKVVRTVAEAISARQRLTVPISVLDSHGLLGDANILASENVLAFAFAPGKREVGFFHESFFDYAFARVWIERGETLVAFLVDGEQELFRRGQVRQILMHLREQDPGRFIEEVGALIGNTSIRYHIKDVALAALRALPDPTVAECDLVERLLETRHSFDDRIWAVLRTVPWFERLDAEGLMEDWLGSRDPRLESGAINLFPTVVREHPDRIAQLLQSQVGYSEHYAEWLLWAVRFATLHKSRPLFDLLLGAIRSGAISNSGRPMWIFAYDLAEHQPGWAVELLATHLVLAPNALAMGDDGRIAALLDRDHAIIRLTGQAAAGAPNMYCDLLLPYMQAVMRKTEFEFANHLLYDRHFCYRQPAGGMIHELEDALLLGAAAAIRDVVAQDPTAARPLLDSLAMDRHDAAQWLLYEGLRAAPAANADRALEILLEGRERFLSGYVSNGVWAARLLIKAISPHLPAQRFLDLESNILSLRFPWERRHPGWYVFCLLSAMEDTRLSEPGRRRLGELRRLHDTEEPPEPEGVTVGFVGPPIPAEAAQHMTDDQWLGAIARHGSDREDFRTFRGGARELSQVLKQATVEDPLRFARLALSLTAAAHPSYGDAVLDGLSDADSLPDPGPIFDAIHHLADLQLPTRHGWHGSPLRRYLKTSIPDDIIQLVIDEALHADSQASGAAPDDGRSHSGRDLFEEGINTDRGKAALMLGDILIHDADGHRTSLVLPVLDRLASDPSMAVRTCVAHVITACLRHARPAALAAFEVLERGADRVFAAQPAEQLVMYIGNGGSVALVSPLIGRMLGSPESAVLEAGGRLAAFAGIEWQQADLLSLATTFSSPAVRKGAASLCAHLLPHTTDPAAASAALVAFFNDPHEGVREASAQMAGQLRGRCLRPHRRLVSALIGSASFEEAESQLLITLERAPDRVDDLAIQCAQRYISVHGAGIGNTATRAAGDAREVGQLALRALVQASSADRRRAALDIIDQLLLLDAYGMAELVGETERTHD